MNFSWLAFCKERGIDYVTSGAHSARGNIHIKCPWCGPDDRTQHMGLSLNVREPFYGCWRNQAHRGRNPARLVSVLLDCTWEEAQQLVDREDTSSVDGYEAAIARVLASRKQAIREEEVKELLFPTTFYPLYKDSPGRDRYLDYLYDRGFDDPEAMADLYGLHYCRVGTFARRIIVPVQHEGRLVNWTGRDVTGKARLRYSSLSDKPDTARAQGANIPAPMPLNSTVLNYDLAARGGKTLVICEGPFDALKVDWYAPKGSHAVAIFGMPKNAQLAVLLRLARKFKRVFVALDEAAPSSNWRLWQEQLAALLGPMVKWLDLPKGSKDPGALSGRVVHDLLS